jgi:hypothetical protein
MRKVLLSGILAFMAVMLTMGSALAFECYNTQRSDRGNAQAARSPALQSPQEILGDPEIVGLCDEGVDYVIEGLQDAGYRTNILINFRALMAGGLERTETGELLLNDGKGIDHLSEEFFEVADGLIGEGFALCA